MRKGIATVSISGDLATKLDAASAARFDAVELFDADVVASTMHPEDIASRCADLGLAIELFQPLRDVVGVEQEVFERQLRFARAKFDLMERLAATRALLCSAVHPQAIDHPEQTADQLGQVGALAESHGFTLAFEALAWGTHVNRVHQARDAIERVAMPNVGLCLDTFHALARGDGPESLEGLAGDRIAFVQIADAHRLSMDVLEWSRHHRCFPGQGALDVTGLVAAAIEAGYRGPLSLEVFSDIVREADPRETASDAMRSLLYLEEQLRISWESRPSESRPRVELFDPPRAEGDPRVELVTIAVHPRDAALPGLLSLMGFVEEASGPGSGDVTQWRNGQSRIALDARSDLTVRRPKAVSRPAVTGIVMSTDDDAAALAARAEALHWPLLDRSSTTGGRTATRSPVGVEVELAGSERRVPSAHVGELPASSGWGPVDHIGVAVDGDHSDAEVSFYRTIFGLRPGPVSEFIDPAGRLRSRVLEPVSAELRVVLNIAVRTPSRPPVVGVNQIAFRCTDLLSRVEQMRQSGVPLLPVPDSYFDDLDARLAPDPPLLATLRRLGVFYDRDTEGGELLHIYTPVIGGQFYIELLERRGGYAGFGAANTPVRLAAQAAARWP